ncbi:MAG: hypothetical protein ACSHYB_09730 [Roseibacillus sp.]
MKYWLLFLLTASHLVNADEEIELTIAPAYELSFQMEEGKFYLLQSSPDMENWFSFAIEGSDREYRSARFFSNPQTFHRVIETTAPPQAAAPPTLLGKRLSLKELVFNFPEPLSYETFQESDFLTTTSGNLTELEGPVVATFSYGYFKEFHSSSTILRTLTDGTVEQIRLTFETASTGQFYRQTQLNGVEVSIDFGDFEIADTPS